MATKIFKLDKNKTTIGPFLSDVNNLEIVGEDVRISLNLRNASIVSDNENHKLIIFANIIVEIDYSEKLANGINSDYRHINGFISMSRRNRFP